VARTPEQPAGAGHRRALAEHLDDNDDLIVGSIIWGTVACIIALSRDSEATAIT
jgi:hypothetical protein